MCNFGFKYSSAYGRQGWTKISSSNFNCLMIGVLMIWRRKIDNAQTIVGRWCAISDVRYFGTTKQTMRCNWRPTWAYRNRNLEPGFPGHRHDCNICFVDTHCCIMNHNNDIIPNNCQILTLRYARVTHLQDLVLSFVILNIMWLRG